MSGAVVRVAFAVYAAFAVLASTFAAGYALDDPGGAAGVGMVAAWLVPMLGLSVLALLRPATGARLASPITGVAVVALTLQAVTANLLPESWGPVAGMLCLVVGTFLACLGLARPGEAGIRLLVLAVAALVAVVLNLVLHVTGALGPGPGVGASTLVMVLPQLVLAAVYLAAAPLGKERESVAHAAGSPPR